MIRIELVNNDDKDYCLSSSLVSSTIEIIDSCDSGVIGKSQLDLFGYSKWDRFYSVLELKNEDKIYMFC